MESKFVNERKANNRLMIYNMFPRRYALVAHMIADLPRIKSLGFNVVWINPIQQASEHRFHGDERTSSLYAMTNPDKYADFLPDCCDEILQAFTGQAKSLGLIPMFDLVLSHIGRGATILEKTPGFFDLQAEDYPDVVPFDFSTSDTFENAFEAFWKPYIDKYLKLGFIGIRVDQAKPKKLPPTAQKKIYDYISQKVESRCIVFAEVLFDNDEVQSVSNQLKPTGITHITNSLYWVRSDPEARRSAGLWNRNNATLHEIGQKTLAYAGRGGSIGFPGTHDGLTVACKVLEEEVLPQFRKNLKKSGARLDSNKKFERLTNLCEDQIINVDPNIHQKKIKEKIAMVALTSDGGWYLMCGDEFGCLSQCSVFRENYRGGTNLLERWGGKYNFSEFITQLNCVISQLPPVLDGEWCEHFFYESIPDAFIVFKHFKPEVSQSWLIILNVGHANSLAITQQDLNDILKLSKHCKNAKPLPVLCHIVKHSSSPLNSLQLK
jgi:alpha-amylase